MLDRPEPIPHLPTDHAPHTQAPAGHKHDHHGHGHHGHDHHDHAAMPRTAYQPAFSLFALSAPQRLALVMPPVVALWLAALWAIGAV